MADFCADSLTCLVDLHLHLDGAISVASAKQLAKMKGAELPETEEELVRKMRVEPGCRSLTEFLEKFDFPCSLLTTKETIRQSVVNLLSELSEQGVMYAEIRFAPQLLTGEGLSQKEVVCAAIEGLLQGHIPAKLILCCMRGSGNEDANIETVKTAAEFLGKGVAALDLAGAEALFPTADFGYIFELAKKEGVPYIIHAGEADGPQSIRDAIRFGALRIGHGVHAIEDPGLVSELAESKIPLEVCPTSNLQTIAFPDGRSLPIREFLDAGLYLTVNTDDPAIEGTQLRSEFNYLISQFGLGREDVKSLLLNSVNASFAEEELKESLREKIEAQLA